MLTALTLRNVVCPVSIAPTAFPIDEFAQKLGLDEVEQQIQLPQMAIWEYTDLRLQVLPERVQLGFKPSVSQALVGEAVREFAQIGRGKFNERRLIFNANLRMTGDEEGWDPTSTILDASSMAQKLGGENPRGGVWLIYDGSDGSGWWTELVPDPVEERDWVFSIQRTFPEFPEDPDAAAPVIAWFQDAEEQLIAQAKLLSE